MTNTRLPGFAAQLKSDPDFIVAYMLDRDMPTVVDNLRGAGFVVNTPQDVYNSLNQLIEQQPQGFIDAFTGLNIGGASAETGPDLSAAITAREVAKAFAQVGVAARGRGAQKMGPYDPDSEPGGPATPPPTDNDEGGGLFNFGGTEVDWSDVGRALATGVLVLLGNNGQSTVNLDPNAQANLAAAMAAEEQRLKRTTLWLVLGAIALVVAIILIVVFTRKAAK